MIDAKTINEEYVDQATAAKILNVSRSRINKLCRDGRFQNAIKTGWSWLIPKSSVENFKRLRPGPKPRTNTSKIILENIIKQADNLNVGDIHDQ